MPDVLIESLLCEWMLIVSLPLGYVQQFLLHQASECDGMRATVEKDLTFHQVASHEPVCFKIVMGSTIFAACLLVPCAWLIKGSPALRCVSSREIECLLPGEIADNSF